MTHRRITIERMMIQMFDQFREAFRPKIDFKLFGEARINLMTVVSEEELHFRILGRR